MSKKAFAQVIISKLNTAIGKDGGKYTKDSATSAMTAVTQGITEYLIANTTVYVGYAGIIPSIPSPIPDPVVADTFKIVGVCQPTGPSNHFDDWIKRIESNIISGFQLAPVGTAGLVFPTKPFLNIGIATIRENLKSAHNIDDKSPQQAVWEVVCGGIMDWINTIALNSTPGAASRPTAPSTGIASITKIVIA